MNRGVGYPRQFQPVTNSHLDLPGAQSPAGRRLEQRGIRLLITRFEMGLENPLELRIDENRILAVALNPNPDDPLVEQDIAAVKADQGAKPDAGAEE